jgi:D-glycero-D-manno-heptose 1,7-bisphosphate phosphatase
VVSASAAVFLDRDGTMIADVGYLSRVADVAFYPWTVDAIRALNHAGFPVVVVTNQSGIAKGLLTEDVVADVHRAMTDVLAAGGASVAAYYYCPHHARGSVPAFTVECDCRKPRSGLIDRAARELGLDPARSFVVGDKWSDVGLARAAGARGLLVRTGLGAAAARHPEPGLAADAIVDNLAAAASWILRTDRC